MKKSPNFNCEYCGYHTRNKKDFSKHLLTAKHLKGITRTEKSPPIFSCICGKEYKARNSLWYHTRTCSSPHANQSKIDNTLVFELIRQNSELKELVLEQSKHVSHVITNNKTNIQNQTINNNHQKFNLNFFLNDTCKDAMNMSEFIQNIIVDFAEIENIGKLGYVSGMTNMIIERIKQLDITKRPLHCTDLKREIMYIKDNDEWDKDSPSNDKLHQMLKVIAHKNYQTIPIWRTNHPECGISDHPKYNVCVDMMKNVIGDVGKEQFKLDRKVIKNLSSSILVCKE